MAVKKWTLIDVAERVFYDEFVLTSEDLGSDLARAEIRKSTLRGGLADGVDVVRIHNGRLAFDVLPTRGMGIWKAWLDDEPLGWQSPIPGPVHPKLVPLMEPGGLGWLDGFDELLVRCGLDSNGPPEFDAQGRLSRPLHGRIANRPAQRVEIQVDDAQGELAVIGVVEETRFHFGKLRLTSRISTRLGERHLRIRDEIENCAASPTTAQMLYHINIGQPLLDPGSRVVVAARRIVPRDPQGAQGLATWDVYAAPQADFAEEAFFLELIPNTDGWASALLKNAAGTRGASVHFHTTELPCFTLWKDTRAEADGYVTGLEPGTNFPNPRTFETQQGRVVALEPGQRVALQLGLEIHHGSDQVRQAEQTLVALQADVSPEIHPHPTAPWCNV